MGAHSSAESLLAGVESDSIRVKAAALAVQLTGWLQAPPHDDLTTVYCPAGPENDGVGNYHSASSDLVEWCRSARDVLEAVGRG